MEELKLSKHFYKKQDYEKSLEYAYQALHRNGESEEYRQWAAVVRQTQRDKQSIDDFMSADLDDYYKVLRVPAGCTKEDLKKSYRKLAKEIHPDKNKNADSAFKVLTQAYETLADDGRRREYDVQRMYGAQGVQGARVQAEPRFHRHSPFVFTPNSFVFSYSTPFAPYGSGNPYTEEFLRAFFRADPRMRRRREREQPLTLANRLTLFIIFMVIINILR